MKKDSLVKRLAVLGFPLLEVEESQDVNLALADVVRSKDMRLWEGFPVVLANSAEKGAFDYGKTEGFLTNSFDKLRLGLLVALSLALYRDLGFKFGWFEELYKLLSPKEKMRYKEYLKALQTDRELSVQVRHMSGQRLKDTFRNYFRNTAGDFKELLSLKEEFGLEYALSQVFSPKQKDLFLKKLKNEKLTKTEKEYFSRVVKKKALALANTELHRLAKKLFE